jgi:sterol desaturase/sphingolipid hydroxylase (fatty acid hydroxylase superfamily)
MPTSDLLSGVREFQTLATFSILVLLSLWETIGPFIAFSNRIAGPRIQHAGRNVFLAVANLTIQRFLFIGAWVWATTWATNNQFGLLNITELPFWAHAMGALLLFDVWTYWWHRMNHELFFFWRFHQVHHTDTEMDVTTAYRFHFGEMALSSLIRIPLIALFGVELWEIALFDLVLFANVQFHHANIGLPMGLDKIYRIFLTSPEMHKVHHSKDPKELNSNYTALLSIWDRLFGTFKLNPNPANIEFGVLGNRKEEDQKLASLLKCPFKIERTAWDRKKKK